ncbi:WD-repeat protein [Cylindrospermum sp. NIES-4074]|nr:WD-repeat protein [Cylindrospermum sp. NIES-4074]
MLTKISSRLVSDCRLLRRSLIEETANGFTQQFVIMEYMTERLIEQVSQVASLRDATRTLQLKIKN